MFSGIIVTQGRLKGLIKTASKISLTITVSDTSKLAKKTGDSIAVNGICLTVTQLDATEFRVDLMPETLRRTNLEKIRQGALVNLEPALLPTTRIAGHFVLGHVDTTAMVFKRENEQTALILTFKMPKKYLPFIAEKGSIAINGVSLTVMAVDQSGFSVSLIPLTQQITNLGSLQVGEQVNVEVDVLSRYLLRQEEVSNES
ncbi:riboflavin synthase [Liquorilactobacillus nagelii]|uniref:riboflavin synthase n=1 Tax=Liquorilactobacillus nagelii TaxID=82688 RepID=UPI001CC91970|nr:riboflavin synthase [Liquorilactobacillus nagelii]ULQ50239.1 riboflavin synthase [Liquorilactobacillus nagelii]